MLSKSGSCSKNIKIIFQKIIRHTIKYNSVENLIKFLKFAINPDVTNGIHCTLPTLSEIQNSIVSAFPGVKFINTELFVIDLINKDDQLETITTEHNRAHRGLHENFQQISREYYFPNMKKLLKTIITNCKICLENNYQLKPPDALIGQSPVPSKPGEILHIDVFIISKHLFLTCVDKLTKFAIVICTFRNLVF